MPGLNEPFLGLEHFNRITEQSKQVLGERYTPEFHLDLPIADFFDGIGLAPDWWTKLESVINSWLEFKSNLEIRCFTLEEYITESEWIALKEYIAIFYQQLCIGLKEKHFLKILEKIKTTANELTEMTQACLKILPHQSRATEKEKDCRLALDDFDLKMSQMLSFFNGKKVLAATRRTALLHGEAGIGKSHLLCDIALQRLQQNLPTVFLLGQHYAGCNPLDPNPRVGAGLLDELIHEGVLAEDILPAEENGKRGQPVVRFTYERFSDYFVANQLIEHYITDGNLQAAFEPGRPLGNPFSETYKYGIDGILEAMVLGIAMFGKLKVEGGEVSVWKIQ